MAENTIYTDIEKLEKIISEALMNEWEAQGHSMGGKVVRDIEYQVKIETNRIILSGLMYPYGGIQAAGVKASKIPYSGRSGRGGKSLYIAALQNYVKQRMGIDDAKKSLGIAFAIAETQKKQGMPTQGSFRFTSTGKRTDWIEEALKKDENKITSVVSEMAFNVMRVQFDVMINKWQVVLNEK